MCRDDANAESVCSAFRRGHGSLIKVTAVAILSACVEDADGRVFDSAVIRFAMVRFDANVIWIDISEMNARADLERFADENVLSIFVADLHVVNANLRPIFPHPRFPLA